MKMWQLFVLEKFKKGGLTSFLVNVNIHMTRIVVTLQKKDVKT